MIATERKTTRLDEIPSEVGGQTFKREKKTTTTAFHGQVWLRAALLWGEKMECFLSLSVGRASLRCLRK